MDAEHDGNSNSSRIGGRAGRSAAALAAPHPTAAAHPARGQMPYKHPHAHQASLFGFGAAAIATACLGALFSVTRRAALAAGQRPPLTATARGLWLLLPASNTAFALLLVTAHLMHLSHYQRRWLLFDCAYLYLTSLALVCLYFCMPIVAFRPDAFWLALVHANLGSLFGHPLIATLLGNTLLAPVYVGLDWLVQRKSLVQWMPRGMAMLVMLHVSVFAVKMVIGFDDWEEQGTWLALEGRQRRQQQRQHQQQQQRAWQQGQQRLPVPMQQQQHNMQHSLQPQHSLQQEQQLQQQQQQQHGLQEQQGHQRHHRDEQVNQHHLQQQQHQILHQPHEEQQQQQQQQQPQQQQQQDQGQQGGAPRGFFSRAAECVADRVIQALSFYVYLQQVAPHLQRWIFADSSRFVTLFCAGVIAYQTALLCIKEALYGTRSLEVIVKPHFLVIGILASWILGYLGRPVR